MAPLLAGERDVPKEFERFDAFTRRFKEAASGRPHVFLLDDVQWADDGSQRLLRFFAREVRRSKVVIVCTYRDTHQAGDARARVGICMPLPGFLQGLRDIATKNGALLIFDEVKTGAKLGWGGASEYFAVKPDMICLAKSIGGGLPLAAFATSKSVMDLISEHKVFHGGTYNTNPVSMAAGLATFRHVLTRENYAHVEKITHRLVEGLRHTIDKNGIQAYVALAGANGAVMFYPKEIRNYRDWEPVDVDLWRHYWFGMVNRGVMPQPYWWDEQWTMSVQHTEADIDKHIAAFEDIAPALSQAQQERSDRVPVAAAH